jgi:hypothetical protein
LAERHQAPQPHQEVQQLPVLVEEPLLLHLHLPPLHQYPQQQLVVVVAVEPSHNLQQ